MQREPSVPIEAAERLALGDFVLDLALGELLDRAGRPADLRPQALKVLLVLGERPGQVVGKEELQRRVWGDVIVTDDSLVQAVGDIRRLIGDAGHARVRTMPRRGYVLDAAPVHAQVAPAAPVAAPASPAATQALPRPGRLWVAGAFALLVAAVAAVLVFGLTPQTAPVPDRSLAILPFEPDDPAADSWFADAVTGDLNAMVARWPDVRVIGRGTMQGYRGKGMDPRQVARELGVAYVLSGRVRRDGDQARIAVELVDAARGHVAWAETMDIRRRDLPGSVGDIAGGLAKTLLVEFGDALRTRTPRLDATQADADDLAMRGMSMFLKSLGPANFEQARQLFEQAVAQDPRSIRGLAGVSLANSMGVIFHWVPDEAAALRRAEDTLAKLEAIDSRHHLTLMARGSLTNVRADWAGLLAVSGTLIEHLPNDPTSHHHRCSALLRLGRFDESIPACERALSISPRDSRAPIWNALIGMSEYMRGRPAEAAERARVMVSANANVPFYSLLLAAALADSGRKADAEEILREFRVRNPTWDSARIAVNWPATNPRFLEGRERIAQRVRELGLP